MKVKVPYVAWRDGRPRFVPGPSLRSLGFAGRDLRHEDGRWFSADEAYAWAAQNTDVIASRRAANVRALPAHGQPRANDALGYVYFMWSGRAVKIGWSRDPFVRAVQLKTAMPTGIGSFAAVPASRRQEALLHRALAAHRREGEWFIATPEVVDVAIKSLLQGRVVLPQSLTVRPAA